MSTQNNLLYFKFQKKAKISSHNKMLAAKEQQPNNSSDSDSDSDSDLPNDEEMQGNGIDLDAMMKIEIDEQPFEEAHSEAEKTVWSTDDDHELIRKLKVYVKPDDRVNYKTRIAQIPWENVAFRNHTANHCRNRFAELLKPVRRYRNLEEIVDDVKKTLRKSLTSYQLFVQDQVNSVKSSGDFDETLKKLQTLYDNLSTEQRAVYIQRAKDLQMESKSNPIYTKAANATKTSIKSNQASNKPKTPFTLFSEHSISTSSESDKKILRQMYDNMSMDGKYKWIIQAIHLAPTTSVADFLNKEEQRIFQGKCKGCPTAFSLYSKVMIPKLKDQFDGKTILKEIGRRWKLMNDLEQKMYVDAAKVEKDRIDKEQRAFNERHGILLRKSKKRKSISVLEPVPEAEPVSHTESSIENNSVSPKKKLKLDDQSRQQEVSYQQVASQQNSPNKSKLLPTHFNTSTPIPIGSVLNASNDKVKKDRIDQTTPVSEKKSKKHKKNKDRPQPPDEKLSWIEYIAKHLEKKAKKAEKAYEKLEKKEQKRIKAEFKNYNENYETQLVAYLDSLPREEADAYLKQIKASETTVDESRYIAVDASSTSDY